MSRVTEFLNKVFAPRVTKNYYSNTEITPDIEEAFEKAEEAFAEAGKAFEKIWRKK
jgi:hypothetical protein